MLVYVTDAEGPHRSFRISIKTDGDLSPTDLNTLMNIAHPIHSKEKTLAHRFETPE
jgi:hypothetical protein